MDYKVNWSFEAITDLEEISNYISKDSAYYASSFVQEILEACKSLNILPERGRIVPESDDTRIRELKVKEYRVMYKITDNTVTIIGIIHGRRSLIKFFSKE